MMFKLLWLFLLVINLLSNKVLALKPEALIDRLSQLTATYETKVGVVFIDLQSGWTFSIHGSSEFPAASVAKVPIMAAAYHLSEMGKINLAKKILFKESDKLGGSGVLQWLKGGREYTLWNLIRLMIVLSDNTATKLVVNTLGMPTINAYCNSLGLHQTKIVDPTMLNEPPSPEVNKTSPWDMAQLMAKIERADNFTTQSRKEMLSFLKKQRYHWGIWRGVPAGVVVADKTGNLEGVLNDVGIVYTKKGNYVLSIFTWGFKKQRDARLLINEISRIAYEEYTGEKVLKQTEKIRNIKKQKKITRQQSRRRPFVKYRRRWGRHGAVLNRKSRTYLRR